MTMNHNMEAMLETKDLFPDYPEAHIPLPFELPSALEAGKPPEARGLRRDEVRLMVSHLGDDSIVHSSFTDLPQVSEGRRHPRHQHQQRHYERSDPRQVRGRNTPHGASLHAPASETCGSSS